MRPETQQSSRRVATGTRTTFCREAVRSALYPASVRTAPAASPTQPASARQTLMGNVSNFLQSSVTYQRERTLKHTDTDRANWEAASRKLGVKCDFRQAAREGCHARRSHWSDTGCGGSGSALLHNSSVSGRTHLPGVMVSNLTRVYFMLQAVCLTTKPVLATTAVKQLSSYLFRQERENTVAEQRRIYFDFCAPGSRFSTADAELLVEEQIWL